MQINLPTNHNFYKEAALNLEELRKGFSLSRKREVQQLVKDLFAHNYELTTKHDELEQVRIFHFKNMANKLEEEEQLILRLFKEKEQQHYIQTGLFAGVLFHKGYKFNVGTQYGMPFLKRMLNFVNDIYVDTQEIAARKAPKTNEFQQIIAYLFIQSLEKAAVIGLPKVYQTSSQRSAKVRGKIDLNAYLKKDIPFKGKLTTSFREQVLVQSIVDVLYLSCKKLEQDFGFELNRKIHNIYQVLKQNYSGKFVNAATIQEAKNHKALINPIFGIFKKVLNFAEIILENKDLLTDNPPQNKLKTYGYLFDISQLFEVYLQKLLSRAFPDWEVNEQETLRVYNSQFYGRYMFPDLVMRHKESRKVIVFDAKFKKMRQRKKDVDRSDFYQIHSYIGYYQPDVILGGLLYPLSQPLDSKKAYPVNLFEHPQAKTQFIVDGIYVEANMDMQQIMVEEERFLTRLQETIDCCVY